MVDEKKEKKIAIKKLFNEIDQHRKGYIVYYQIKGHKERIKSLFNCDFPEDFNNFMSLIEKQYSDTKITETNFENIILSKMN